MADAIRWEESRAVPEFLHGYVGIVRAFTIERSYTRHLLKIHLPGRKGWRGNEEFSSEQAAQQRAAAVIAEFLADISASSA